MIFEEQCRVPLGGQEYGMYVLLDLANIAPEVICGRLIFKKFNHHGKRASEDNGDPSDL